MDELSAVDPSLLVRGGDGDPRLGELVVPCARGDVSAIAQAAKEGAVCVALIGLADDRGVRNGGGRAGAQQGPTELRRWLYKMTTGGGGELSRLRLFDLGDAEPGEGEPRSLEAVHALAEEAVRAAIAAGARAVLLGGGHDGAYASQSGLLRALGEQPGPGAPARLCAINVDAHCDVRGLRDGTIITSGTPFRRLRERWQERFTLVEFGVQMQHNALAHVEWARAQGWPVLELRRLREDGPPQRRFARQLERARGSYEALSVSFDLDAVEAASAPGVSAPCPDGFTARELLDFSRAAGSEEKVRLIDVMECAPALDESGRTARLGAAAIWSFLAGACGG